MGERPGGIFACRLIRGHDGIFKRSVVMRTPNWAVMSRYLIRSRRRRAWVRKVLWIEQYGWPATRAEVLGKKGGPWARNS